MPARLRAGDKLSLAAGSHQRKRRESWQASHLFADRPQPCVQSERDCKRLPGYGDLIEPLTVLLSYICI